MSLAADDVFEHLAAGFLVTCRELCDGAVSGERAGLRYGAAGTRIPGLNRLMVTAMDPATVDAELDSTLAELSRFPVLSAWLAPSATPGDLVERFEARGFILDTPGPAMAMSLAALPAAPPIPGVSLSVATTREEVTMANRALAEAFEAGPEFGDQITAILADGLIDPTKHGRLVLAKLRGAPVATAVGSLDGSVVTVYNVGTVPAARSQGLGGLVTLAVLEDAKRRGARDAVLEATEAGYPVYRRLGFEEAGRFTILLRARPD